VDLPVIVGTLYANTFNYSSDPLTLQWNTPSIDFYEKRLGATPQSEWEGERIEGDEGIKRLAELKNA
jgi:hypothetical protein